MNEEKKSQIYNSFGTILLHQFLEHMQGSMKIYSEDKCKENANAVIGYYSSLHTMAISILGKLRKALDYGIDEDTLNSLENIKDIEKYLDEVIEFNKEDA